MSRSLLTRVTPFVAFGIAVLVGVFPDVAYACPSCFSGNDANRIAYIVTFVILTVLPLACVGGIVYWLVKRIAADEAARGVADADDAKQSAGA